MPYKPAYDTTIQTRTTVERLETVHLREIDWSYPFNEQEHTGSEPRDARIERQKGFLQICANNLHRDGCEVWVSDFGGVPRIWQQLLEVGMVSRWPYWTPRPCVRVRGIVDHDEWIDWWRVTAVEVRPPGPWSQVNA